MILHVLHRICIQAEYGIVTLDFTGIPLDCYDMSNLFIEDIKMGMIFEHRRSSYICGEDMDIGLADNMKAFGIYHHH